MHLLQPTFMQQFLRKSARLRGPNRCGKMWKFATCEQFEADMFLDKCVVLELSEDCLTVKKWFSSCDTKWIFQEVCERQQNSYILMSDSKKFHIICKKDLQNCGWIWFSLILILWFWLLDCSNPSPLALTYHLVVVDSFLVSTANSTITQHGSYWERWCYKCNILIIISN